MVVGCQPYAPAAFTPRDIPGTHFELTFIQNLIDKSHLGYNCSLIETDVMPLVSICELCNEIIFVIVFNEIRTLHLTSLVKISYTIFILYISLHNNQMCTV